jgi:hypothetical protein
MREAGAAPACSTGNQCDQGDDLELACDEPTDCPNFLIPQRCCLRLGGGGLGGGKISECDIQCGQNGGTQLCKTNADCGDGGANQPTCNAKTCGGYNVHVCGNPANCQ